MNVQPATSPSSSLTVGDVYYILFRHKWKIVVCTFLGLVAAAATYKLHVPSYQSEAKLFIRYVTVEDKALGPATGESVTKSPDQRGETIMNSEQQILTSLDLITQVAIAVGPEKLLAKYGGGTNPATAALLIRKNLVVEAPPYSSVIDLSFTHEDPSVVQPVLVNLIDSYLKRHNEVHQASGFVGDFLSKEKDQYRSQLLQTEDELTKLRNKAGIVSMEDARKQYSDKIARISDDILMARADLAEQTAIYNQEVKHLPDAVLVPATAASAPATPVSPASPSATPAPVVTASVAAAPAVPTPTPASAVAAAPEPEVPAGQIEEYRSVVNQLDQLRKSEQDLLTQFTAGSTRVMGVRAQIAAAQSERTRLEKAYPALLSKAPSPSGTVGSPTSDSSAVQHPVVTAAKLDGLQARIAELNAQLNKAKADASALDEIQGTLSDLNRRKAQEEANYLYYAKSVEQAQINEALGAGKVSNISEIETPTPPYNAWTKPYKLLGEITAAGLFAGIGWALLIEFVLDQSVRRPIDVERSLRVPLFLSIPQLGVKGRRHTLRASPTPLLEAPKSNEDGALVPVASEAPVPPWDPAHVLHPFHETLRDRLIAYFESINLTHKPKLVAITGIGGNAGVTTTAAGLASCLSETGEGNVLLVDMTAGQGSSRQFYKGKTVCGLEEILSVRSSAQMQDNLFVVAEEPGSDRLSRILPQRFSKLVPKLKASDFDYIIFDMPPVNQISITPRLAGFMDMVLLVLESEKTDRDIAARATELLAKAKKPVGVVLNKTKSYVPARLNPDREFLLGT